MYTDQAYYYLGISAERQQHIDMAKRYLNAVMREDLVLAAREKVVAFELLEDNFDAAIATVVKLREQFSVFAPDTYVLQADILRQQQKTDEALRLLTTVKRALLQHLQNIDASNLAYQLSYAQLLMAHESTIAQGLSIAQNIINVRYDDPRYDSNLHLEALNLLAENALNQQDYMQVIDYLQTPYDVLPTLSSGVLLLRAYQGLDETEKVQSLLEDLQRRFAFGQHNINDRVQQY